MVGKSSQCVTSRRKCRQSISIGLDRKSTRLNSSHANISYAVFCLKKKKITYQCLSLFQNYTLLLSYLYRRFQLLSFLSHLYPPLTDYRSSHFTHNIAHTLLLPWSP